MESSIEIRRKLKTVFSEQQADVLATVGEEVIRPVVDDLSELKAIVRDLAVSQKALAEAQQRTERRVEELAEAQQRTEKRVEELAEAQQRTEKRIEELAEAQQRTEQRIGELAEAQQRTERRVEALEDAVQRLAEAQQRTEQRIGELAEAQQRTEQRIEELAEAQQRTEQRIEELAKAHQYLEQRMDKLERELRATRKEVGGLAMTVGYTLENEAYRALPSLLERDHGIVVQDYLVRRYVTDRYGESIEVNIIGKALRQGREVTIIGEGKAQLSQKGVEHFIRRKLVRLEGVMGEIFPVLVTHMVSNPKVEAYTHQKGIALYHSFQFGQQR